VLARVGNEGELKALMVFDESLQGQLKSARAPNPEATLRCGKTREVRYLPAKRPRQRP